MVMAIRLGASALGLAAAALAGAAWAADPYDIDVVLPLTGSASSLGTAEQVALRKQEPLFAGADGIGGRSVRFVFHDDQSSPQVAVQLANAIKAKRPAVVLGSATVAMCNAMAPVLKDGPVLYCLSPALYAAPGSSSFSSSNATRDLLAAQLRFLKARGLDRIALITSTDASGQDAQRQVKALMAGAEAEGLALVDATTFNPTDVSASAQVQHMKAAAPKVVIAWSTGAGIGTVFKAIKDAGLDLPVVTTDGNMTYAAMTRFADVLPRELFIPSPEWPRSDRSETPDAVKAAKERFFAAFAGGPDRPDAASSFAWDPAALVLAGLKQIGPEATGQQLKDHLAKLAGFAGINGTYDFPRYPQRGLGDDSVIVARWDAAAGTWTTVSHPRGLPLD